MGAALAAIALVSPLESGLLPGPAGGLAGSAAAQEPPSVVDGDPGDCPTTRPPTEIDYQPDADGSLCVLMLWACPASPVVNPAGLMRLSVAPDDVAQRLFEFGHDPGDITYGDDGLERYPEFCEERVYRSESPEDHHACTILTGHTVLDDGELCRILYPVTCVAGLHQDGSHTCRAVQRRSWTCDPGYRPSNRFPICFRPVDSSGSDTVPACRRGAPDLGVFDDGERACDRYVGRDVLTSPGDIACRSYTTGAFRGLAGFKRVRMRSNPGGNRYWCEFNAARLRLYCHGPDQPADECGAQPALCLKRASRTGGCDRIIETIRCRAHQTALAQGRTTAETLRQQGCTPCVNLPFQPPTCQDEAVLMTQTSRRNSVLYRYSRQEGILRCRIDFRVDPLVYGGSSTRRCPSEPAPAQVCADPPTGALEWHSNRFSGLAVVNVPVIVRIVDLPFEFSEYGGLYYEPEWRRRPRIVQSTAPRELPLRSDAASPDARPRQLFNIDPSGRYRSVHEIARQECVPRDIPLFNVEVRELWPDRPADRQAITEMFGADALHGWWDDDSLSAAQLESSRRRLTEARGLVWWNDLTTAQEQQDRDGQLLDVIECHERTQECVWRPQHPGFYQLVGAGGWPMVFSNPRWWGASRARQVFCSVYTHPACSAASGAEAFAANMELFTSVPDNRRWLLDRLGELGLSLGDVGLEEVDGTIGLRAPDDRAIDWLYSEAAAGLTGCPWPIDLRVHCPGSNNAGNYTRTEPVGIVVHEVRTRTVAAVQSP